MTRRQSSDARVRVTGSLDSGRLMSFALFLAGGPVLVWLCIEGWHSDDVATAGVWCSIAFAIAVLAFRTFAWLRTPANEWNADDSIASLMMARPCWRWLRAPITIRYGGLERTTTLLGVTPIQVALTWLAIAALLAAWAMAGRLGWVWFPDRLYDRIERKRRIREWIFGF